MITQSHEITCGRCRILLTSKVATVERPIHHLGLGSSINRLHDNRIETSSVWLTGTHHYFCLNCGNSIAIIMQPVALQSCIVEAVINKPALLSGPEVHFLREHISMSRSDVASLLGFNLQEVTDMEHSPQVPIALDRLIRLYISDRCGFHYLFNNLLVMAPNMNTTLPDVRYVMRFDGDWNYTIITE